MRRFFAGGVAAVLLAAGCLTDASDEEVSCSPADDHLTCDAGKADARDGSAKLYRCAQNSGTLVLVEDCPANGKICDQFKPQCVDTAVYCAGNITPKPTFCP